MPVRLYSGEEWRTFTALVHAHDFPETRARWHGLGREAGFDAVRFSSLPPTLPPTSSECISSGLEGIVPVDVEVGGQALPTLSG